MMLLLSLTLLGAPDLQEVALADICGDDVLCYEAESDARGRLYQSWNMFSESAREACLPPQDERRSYRQLEACLIIESVLTHPSSNRETEARIELRPVSTQGSIHAD